MIKKTKGGFNIGKSIKDLTKKTVDYGKAIIYGRNDYPPKVRNIITKIGDQFIKHIIIKRAPVPSILTGALSLFSFGKFGERLDKNFDELFHLFIEIILDNGQKVLLEKNEVINMDTHIKNLSNVESKNIMNTPHITINELLNNTQKYMGKNFFSYSARDNNCQDFIVAIFKSNNIGDSNDITFIKQDTKQLFNDLPILRKIANTITDIGASANVIVTGKGIKKVNTKNIKQIYDKLKKQKNK